MGQAGQADSLEKRRYEPMKEYNEKLNLGKGSAFVKSHLSRLPRTDEVWEADIQPISVWGWDARKHGELWLGMVSRDVMLSRQFGHSCWPPQRWPLAVAGDIQPDDPLGG